MGLGKKGNDLIPIPMTKPAGPSFIMNMIFCGCKTGCKNSCTCRKHGIPCTVACKVCNGENCTNVPNNVEEVVLAEVQIESDESEEETEDFENYVVW